MSTTSGPQFSEISDAASKIRSDLERTFGRNPNKDRLIDRHIQHTAEAGWAPLKLKFDERVSTYHMPAIGETKAVVSLNLGCEGSALTAATAINAARQKGIAFLAFSLVTRDAAGGDTREQLRSSIASNSWTNVSSTSPLHELYDTDRLPTFLVAQSSACAITIDNMLHEGFAQRANATFDRAHLIVPFFDASTAATGYPLDHLETMRQRIFAEAVRNTRNAVWAVHANVLGNGELGHGLDRIITGAKAPTVRMPTRKEGRTLQLYARDILKQLETTPAHHPIFDMPMTSWMSPNDEASCPYSADYFSKLVGADVRTDEFKHMNLKKRMHWVTGDIRAELGEDVKTGDMPPLKSYKRPQPTVEDIVRQTGGVDHDLYEAPIGPPKAVLAM